MTAPNTILITGVPDPPLQGNVITDQQGQETPGFVARLTRIWTGWAVALTQWAKLQGTFTAIPYTSTDFAKFSGGGTWTVDSGDLLTFAYWVVGNTITVTVNIANSTISVGTINAARILLPDLGIGTYVITNTVLVPARLVSGGVTLAGGTAEVVATDNKILIFADAPLPVGADNFDVSFTITFPIQRL